MEKTKYYKVAGHIFSLSMPGDSSLWNPLGNYLPFETEFPDNDGSQAVFCCSLADELPVCEPQLFFRDNPEEDDMSRIDIFRCKDGFIFEMRPSGDSAYVYKLWTNTDFSRGLLLDRGLTDAGRFPIDNSLMLMFALRTASLRTLEMHASVTVKDGKGYLFLGKSGTGKSTHSRMWLENIPGCTLLNDDNPIVRVLEDGSVRVYGSPWSGKTRCYVNGDVPAGGFVQIRQHPENEVTRQGVLDSYISLYSSCSGLKMVEEMNDLLHETIESILKEVPCWLLKCLPDGDAARICYNAVRNGNN